jgi:hypothetical protein
MLDLITRIFPPYEFNPLNVNPLREAVTTVDFEVLRSPDCPIKLFWVFVKSCGWISGQNQGEAS